jgi:hypothetical protein
VLLDFKYPEEDELAWAAGVFPASPAPKLADVRPIDHVALAVAVGAMPLYELRRRLESMMSSGANTNTPVDVCGAEDSCCGSFLDRYLGGGSEHAPLEESELFGTE